MSKKKAEIPDTDLGAAILNLAVDLKVSEVRRMIAVIDRLNIPALAPALEAFQARIAEMESLRKPVETPRLDHGEYGRRERLLDLRK